MIRLEHMNDTIKSILSVCDKTISQSSSQIMSKLNKGTSQVTIKRYLTELVEGGFLIRTGAGRSVKYALSKKGVLLRPINMSAYLSKPADSRISNTHFQFDVFEKPYIELFSIDELRQLDQATKLFRKNAEDKDITAHKKEIMRFIIEFSWKTSQIEGNTYDLLSTEQLLLYGKKAPGHSDYEAQMIMNQKEAVEFIIANSELWQSPRVSSLEMLHSFVAEKLGIKKNLRKSIVGITGTNYVPLSNEFQIKYALELLFSSISESHNIYEKALLAVLGVSYIQPFIDGNKRTSRLVGNAILMSKNYAPLSYRSVDDRTYKEVCLIFYEQNSIEPFKELFIEQYIFSANTYNIAT